MAIFDCIYTSEVLNGKTAFRAIIPEEVDIETAPIFYLLHGLDGNYLSWFSNTDLEPLAEKYGVVMIMPDAKNSFYTDTGNYKYYTQITYELPRHAERYFNLKGERHLAGVSMGGHGAYKIAMKNPDMFKTVASFSGVLDLSEHVNDAIDARKTFCMNMVFGENANLAGTDNDLFSLIDSYSGNLRFYQFCGTEDFLYTTNRKFRDLARSRRLDLTYLEGAGDHTWPVWARQIQHYIPWAIGAQF